MSKPTLFIKEGCPYCAAAIDFLDREQIDYQQVDVLRDQQQVEVLKELSGQTKTPTLVWDGKVLADFGTGDLEKFLASHQHR